MDLIKYQGGVWDDGSGGGCVWMCGMCIHAFVVEENKTKCIHSNFS